MQPYNDFAKQFKRARTNLGYSQSQVARLSGLSQPTVCRYEKGNIKRPDWQGVQAIAAVLKIKLTLDKKL